MLHDNDDSAEYEDYMGNNPLIDGGNKDKRQSLKKLKDADEENVFNKEGGDEE